LFSVILGMWKVDYLIVGQGLAGSCLALEFEKRNKTFLIIDNPQPNSASKVAVGLFNPITGKTNQPTWRATEIFKALRAFYREAEKTLQSKFLTELPIYRPFLSSEEQMKWPAESNAWISKVSLSSRFPDLLNDPFGGIEVRNCGFLKAPAFLKAIRHWLTGKENLMEENFDYSELLPGNKIRYKNIETSHIIFCEGTEISVNPFFNWVPVKKLKGEILIVKTKLPSDVIVNRGAFAVPANEPGTYLIGSTYHHDSTPGNTDSGIKQLIDNAKKIIKNELEITGQNWGHRPTTPDRRPMLGTHPKHGNICIFNGLGTKGVSLAPFFAVHLADWLEGKAVLNKEVNIERFYSLYFQSQERV